MSMEKERKDWPDDDLIKEAQSGLTGQGSVVEMMRRLKDVIIKLENTTTKQQGIIIWLTIVIAVLTFIMAFATVPQIISLLFGNCSAEVNFII